MVSLSKTAQAIKSAVDGCGIFLTTGGLAGHLKISRGAVIDGMNELKTKRPGRYMRIYGMEGGIGPL